MKALGIFFGILLAIVLTILWYFSDNIKGYYTFKEYCERGGGLTVYEPLEKNVGWSAGNKKDAMGAAQLENVLFARYLDVNTEKKYDVRYKGGISLNESSYEISPANDSTGTVYFYKSINYSIKNELRLQLYGSEVLNSNSGKLLAKYYVYGYEIFDRENTLLDISSEKKCHAGEPGSATTGFALSIKMLNTAFRK
jgi:hypothetical protein